MTTEDFVISLFCLVDDCMGKLPKRADASLYPSEVVTIELLYTLKGGFFRAFYRWLKRDFEYLFVAFPDRSRIPRTLRAHRDWSECFLSDPTFFTVIDTYGIELIHPVRHGRSGPQVGKKGKSNRGWIVGIKLCWLVNDRGEVVAWDCTTSLVRIFTQYALSRAIFPLRTNFCTARAFLVFRRSGI